MTKRDHGFEFPEKLGQRLRELREGAGLTQSETAELMGRPPSMQSQVARFLDKFRPGHILGSWSASTRTRGMPTCTRWST